MKFIICLLVMLSTSLLRSQPQEIRSLDDVVTFGKEVDLAVFDIDLTLIKPKDPAFSMGSFMANIDIWNELKEKRGANALLDHITLKESELIEQNAPQIVKKFNRSMALTGCNSQDPYKSSRLKRMNEFGFHFSEGIYFADGKPKGAILKGILESLDVPVKKIVVVDDRVRELVDIEKAMAEMGVECIALHYMGWEASETRAAVDGETFRAAFE